MQHGERKTYVHAKCRCTECIAANDRYMTSYRNLNKEEILKREKDRYLRKRDKIMARTNAYYQREKEAIAKGRKTAGQKRRRKQWQANRRARELGQFVEAVNLEVLWARDRGLCGICGKSVHPDKWSLDHVLPLSKGGLHCYANVQLAHKTCNEKKQNREPTPDEIKRVQQLIA